MPPPSENAVILLSAGLDSSIAAAMALSQGWSITLAVTFNYGQRAARREIEQAIRIAKYLEVPHRVLDLPWFRTFHHRGALLSESELPTPKLSELNNQRYTQESARRVWVPNRNGVFIEIAAGFAEDLDARAVVVGFNREEAETFADNSTAYMAAVSEALQFSSSNKVQVISPTATLNKIEIVAEAKRLNFPLHLLWSCYESHPSMCGQCESCTRLKRALSANEVKFDALFEDPYFK